MSAITLEFDNTLEKSDIIFPLTASSVEESGYDYTNKGLSENMQTSIFGIMVPLIMINNTVIDCDSIISFDLDSTSTLPTISMTVIDKNKLLSNVDKPKHGSEIRVQILPKFDNAYKKIDLTFYINRIDIEGKMIDIDGIYKLPELTQTRFMSLGKQTTYSLFKNVAMATKLGFASNVVSSSDSQYVYCDNISLLQTLENTINTSDTTNHIFNWWIDLWDNINLVDIKERYTTVDKDEDMLIWVAGNVNIIDANTIIDPVPTVATLSNHPALNNTELYVKKYNQIIYPGAQLSDGTDIVFNTYNENSHEYIDYLMQDADIKDNLSIKYKYLGENYGDHNYLFSQAQKQKYLTKMQSECIEVTLKSPLLGLMRGHKVNYIHYVNDDFVENKLNTLEDLNLVDRNVKSNINLDNYAVDIDNPDGQYRIDKTISGQYLINGIEIGYNKNGWAYKLNLVRPTASRPSILSFEN